MGDSPQCGEMSAEQTKGLARSVPPKAVGDCFSLYYQSLRHFVTPPLTRTPKAHCIHFGEPRTQGRLIFNFHKLLDKSQLSFIFLLYLDIFFERSVEGFEGVGAPIGAHTDIGLG